MIRHADLVALRLGGRWCGVLIEGPSGCGKSDLALRSLDHGFSLVADDRVLVWTSGGRLYGRAPDALAGLIEVRGCGVAPRPFTGLAQIVHLVRAAGSPEAVERLPDGEAQSILGVEIPVSALWLPEPSAPAKLKTLIMHLGASN